MYKNIKRFISYCMVFILLINLFPNTMYLEPEAAPIRSVTITNTYVNLVKSQKTIVIRDTEMSNITNKQLSVMLTNNTYHNVTNIQIFEPDIIQATINTDWNIAIARITGTLSDGTIKTITYDNINEGGLPQISSIATPIVNQGESIIANGTGISAIAGTGYTISVGGVPANATGSGNQVSLTSAGAGSFHQGEQDIVVTHKLDNVSGSPNNYTLQNIFDYKKAVRVVGKLDLDGIKMFPTMGDPGSEIKFSRTDLGNYDIYFIKDLNNPSFTQQNKATNVSVTPPGADGGDTIITARVPNVQEGPYHIIFTNIGDVNVRYTLPDQQFRVITIQEKPEVSSVQPNSAPSMTATDVDIYGYFFSKHNVSGFTPDNSFSDTMVKLDGGKLTIEYGPGQLKLGDQPNQTYRVRVIREFEIFIGNTLDVNEVNLSDQNGIQRIRVRTIPQALTQTERRDVIVRIETKIEPELESTSPKFNGVMFNEIVKSNEFTFFPATEVPAITEVTPNIIPVVEAGSVHYINGSLGELHLAIKGDKFLVTRYLDGVERVNMPIITIGGTVVNGHDALLGYEILKDGSLVTGTENNEIGNMILLRFKAGIGEFPIQNVDSREIIIRNPIRKSSQHADPRTFQDVIEFRVIAQNDFPVINNVQPNLVAIDGGDDVVVTGSNLRTGSKVYIENKEVPGITISGDNTKITFKAPKGSRPGTTQLQVVNPNGGGMATYPFIYTTTYTQPKFTLINPNEGTTGTVVTAKGENFLRPDPTVVTEGIESLGGAEIYRLMGTRVLLDDHDINEYNMVGNYIRMTPFSHGYEVAPSIFRSIRDDIFVWRVDINELELGVGFDSVVLFNEAANKFYTISKNARNEFSIEDGLGNNYKIEYVGGQFKAILGGNDYVISFPSKGKMIIGAVEFTAFTPYRIERVGAYDYITGNRVSFIDSKTLLFTVPDLSDSPWTGDGQYDVTIINPDTKRQTLKDAFRYYGDPRIVPKILDVIPQQGPDKGGNIVTILNDPTETDNLRSGFVDTGTQKTKVFIGGVKVADSSVTVSPNGRELTVLIPPYPDNIKNMGLDRITVPIVLVNPDGGTFSISYSYPIIVDGKAIRGYTYVVPTSNPVINSISPTGGPVNGGNTVEIFGSDFREYENGSILPEVYFGVRKAQIEFFSPGYLQVKAPTGSGVVDVFVINNDAGMSNKVKYTYKSSSPTIKSISPGTGNRIGGDLIEIEGTGYEEGEIRILQTSGSAITSTMPLVKVGNRTNKHINRELENSGVIYGAATVILDGGLTVNYIASTESLTVTIRDSGKDYRHTFPNVGLDPVFINTKDLITAGGEAYPYEELIKVNIVDNRLIVDGGYSPSTILRSDKQISARVPFYYTVGKVDLYVINPDGGQAKSSFEYRNPDSRPVITDILKDGRVPEIEQRTGYVGDIKVVKASYKGGNVIEILGSDFRDGAKVQIAGILTVVHPNLTVESANRLSFTMAAVPESQVGTLHRVVVLNEDGGVATSDIPSPPIYIEFIKGESSPRIDKITPDKGPASGGTRVKIEGQDFRRTMDGFEGNTLSVLFGGARVEYSESNNNIEFVDYKTIFVRVPASTNLGEVDVRLENPDGELSNPSGKFTYISKPVISNINPEKLFKNDTVTEVVITGTSFLAGAKVVVGGKVIPVNDVKTGMEVRGQGVTGVDSLGKNIDVAVVDGIEPSSITVQDENTILIKFGGTTEDLDTTDVIIINPDGGISDPYNDFKYEVPVPDKPLVLEAVPGYETTMMLLWSKSSSEILNASDRYEIYAKRGSDSQYTFVGETKGAEFLLKGLQPNTYYDFRVRALNAYGSAIDFAEASARTLRESQDYKQQEKIRELDRVQDQQNWSGKEETVNGRLIRTIGIHEYPQVIDFSLSKYKGQDKFTVAIPASIVANYSGYLNITDGNATFRFSPKDLYIREVISIPTGSLDDAYVRVNFEPVNSTSGTSGIKRTQQQASKAYDLSFELQVEKSISTINPILRVSTLSLQFDSRAYPRANTSKLFMGKYNAMANEFTSVGKYHTAVITERGRYMLLADR